MYKPCVFVVLGLFLMPAVASAAADTLLPHVTGRATHQQTGEFLYTESHACRADMQRCGIEYRDASGILLAVKELDYAEGPYTPAVSLREPPDNKPETLVATDAPVVDAGFDNYVRGNWAALVAGEEVTFTFQAFGFDRTFKMRAAVDKSAGCDASWLCMRVEVNSWLLRLVASPIELAYDRDNLQLKRYRGITNLRGGDLASQPVEILYSYYPNEKENPP